MSLRVLTLTRYSRRGASSRVRIYQYVPALAALGVECDVHPMLGERYLATLYDGAPASLPDTALSYLRRLRALTRRRAYDVTLVQKELLPFVPWAIERGLLGRFVFDIDDAWHLRYSRAGSRLVRAVLGHKVERVMRAAEVVVAGNRYLADVARSAGAGNVHVIPSVVPVDEYTVESFPPVSPLVIGWIGSPTTLPYLERLRPVFEELGATRRVLVRIVGAEMRSGLHFDTESIRWSEQTEKSVLGGVHLGVMPLGETEWELGKCAYKAIQYMAAGRPVVATAVGANLEVVDNGVTGRLVRTNEQWVRALTELADPSVQRRMGLAARERAGASYSVASQAPRLAAVLRAAARARG